MNEVFNKYITTKLPFVTLKSAMTLDGKIATYTADSKWITSEKARKDVHQLRHEHRAILVGVNTVLKDNPQLTTRIPHGRNPLRVILDSTLKIPLDARVVANNEAETWIFTSEAYDKKKKEALEDQGIRVLVTSHPSRVDVKEVVRILGEEQISSVLVEGGGEVNASFLNNGLVDKVVVYVAPKLIGGRMAPTFFEGEGKALMKEAIELTSFTVTPVGPDIKLEGYPVYKKEE
jgi:diaminohydroxyphosphoribosylaminopyrimidine deaminase / 5-amino-6-(5-phosphoribosylamino)uracil reductase